MYNNFNTLINPTDEMFYTQNIFNNTKLTANKWEKSTKTDRWSMNKLYR